MALKIIKYEIDFLSTHVKHQYEIPEVWTNDYNSVEFHFIVKDEGLDLTNASADVLLYMRDGSFFQNGPDDGVTIDGSTVKYTLKENEGNHGGNALVQVVLKTNEPEYPSPLLKFRILQGLETKVAQEQMIHDWTTLVREASEFIAEMKANETQRQTDFDNAQTSKQSTFNTSESNRQSTFNANEQARQVNEGVRVDNEETRKSSESERISNEEGRVAEEETRVEQEQSRVAAEKLRMVQFQDMQLTQDLDTEKSYKTTLEIFNGMPRLKLEEVTHG